MKAAGVQPAGAERVLTSASAVEPGGCRALADRALQSLEKASLRATEARIAILGLMLEQPDHRYGTSEIVHRLTASQSGIGICNIYKTLRELHGRRLIEREWARKGKSVYWLIHERQAPSHQLVCRHCLRAFPVQDSGLTGYLERIGRAHGLVLSHQSVSISVTCADCERTQAHVGIPARRGGAGGPSGGARPLAHSPSVAVAGKARR